MHFLTLDQLMLPIHKQEFLHSAGDSTNRRQICTELFKRLNRNAMALIPPPDNATIMLPSAIHGVPVAHFLARRGALERLSECSQNGLPVLTGRFATLECLSTLDYLGGCSRIPDCFGDFSIDVVPTVIHEFNWCNFQIGLLSRDALFKMSHAGKAEVRQHFRCELLPLSATQGVDAHLGLRHKWHCIKQMPASLTSRPAIHGEAIHSILAIR
mmetsp:Transcript_56072/g.102822  ORF Transcript_56072/g.102822 Transcript_56072/m.102822 type:complete len:213 (+) Transcript_56072:813-1451(+)